MTTEQEGDDPIPPQAVADGEDIPADRQEGDDQIHHKAITDTNKISSDEQEGDERIPSQNWGRYSDKSVLEKNEYILLFLKKELQSVSFRHSYLWKDASG